MNIHPSALLREAEDWLRYDPSTRQMLARVFLVRADWCRKPLQKLDLLCKAIRLAAPSRLRTALIAQAAKLADSGTISKDDLLQSDPEYGEPVIRRGLLLKPRISDNEPGVLFISFENEWVRLLNIDNLKAFAKDYRIVVAPSWSPPHSSLNYMFPRFYPGPVFHLISNPNDLQFFPQLSDGYRSVNLYASSWVDSDLFNPRSKRDRDIDILMVANFGKFKRHHVLFQNLRRMPHNLKVMLVGQKHENRGAQSVLEEARAYGVAGQVTVEDGVYGPELMELFARAKVSLILSKREGSCVVVTESMFADTPVALLGDAEIGSKVFINDETGRLLSENDLADGLMDFLANHHTYHPREWAVKEKIDCQGSRDTLNNFLKSDALEHGEDWTKDIFVHHWRPDPTYQNEADREAVMHDVAYIETTFNLHVKL